MEAEAPARSGWKPLALLVALAFVVACGAAWYLFSVISVTLQQHTDGLLDDGRRTIEETIHVYESQIETLGFDLGAFILSSEGVTPEEWVLYSERVAKVVGTDAGYQAVLYAPRSPDGEGYRILLQSPPGSGAGFTGVDLASDPRLAAAVARALASRRFTLSDPITDASGATVTFDIFTVSLNPAESEPVGLVLIERLSGLGIRSTAELLDTQEFVVGVDVEAELIEQGAVLNARNTAFDEISRKGINSQLDFDFLYGGRTFHTRLVASHGLGVPPRDRVLQYVVSGFTLLATFVVLLMLVVISRNRRVLARQVREVNRAQALTLDALEDVKKAKESAEARRQYVLTLLASIAEAVVAFDETGRITSVNPAGERLFGMSQDALVGSSYRDHIMLLQKGVPAADAARPLSRFLADPLHAKIRDNTFDLRRPDGVIVPLSIEIAGVTAGGKLDGVIATLRDITLEREVDKVKTEFASLASHQMKAPLGAIKWYTELLKGNDYGTLNPQQKEMLDSIADADKRMLRLINSLLSVSRVESGAFAAVPELLSVAKLAHAFVSDNGPAIASRSLAVSEEYDAKLPDVPMDPQLLGAIVQNLLSNAIRYTRPGGRIAVHVSGEGEAIRISVADSGIGIPREAMGTLWNKGFRTKEAEAIDPGGTGLGLYLVKSIIDTTGGEISVKSEVGKGTTFTVSYPLSGMKARAGTRSVEVPEAMEPLKPLKPLPPIQ